MSIGRFLAVSGALGAVTAVVVTWPLVLSLDRAFLDDGTFDAFQFAWNVWWVRESVLVRGASPFFTDLLYYPQGVPLLFHTGSFSLGLLAIPLHALPGGAVTAHNVLVLAAPALTVVMTALLAREVVSDAWAALAAGFVAAVNPITLWFVPVVYLSCGWAIALLLWLWWRLQRTRRASYVVWALVALAFLVFASQEYAMMALAMLGLDTVARTVAPGWLDVRRPWLVGTLAFWAIGGAGLATLASFASANPAVPPPPVHVAVASGWLFGYVTPPWLVTPLVRFWTIYFIGTVPLLLVGVPLVLGGSRGRALLWIGILGSLLLMALGPWMKLRPQFVFFPPPNAPFSPAGIRGPYWLAAQWIPLLRFLRTPYRWLVPAQIAIGVVSALALSAIRARLPQARTRTAATIAVLALLAAGAILDGRGLRAPLVPAEVPAALDVLRSDPTPGAVVHLPAGYDESGLAPFASRYMFLQTSIRRPLLDGTVSRLPKGYFPWRTMQIQSFVDYPYVRYVVLHRDLLEHAQQSSRDHTARLMDVLAREGEVVQDDGTTAVWRLNTFRGDSVRTARASESAP